MYPFSMVLIDLARLGLAEPARVVLSELARAQLGTGLAKLELAYLLLVALACPNPAELA